MKAVGIIAEYNPLHTGHEYHIQKSKEITGADAVVCVMSGSFVQRGEAAVMNKWARAKMALLCGVDLVIELPFCFAAQSAEFFAKGAVQLLSAIGVVDYLCFGSEVGDIEALYATANALAFEGDELSRNIKNAMDTGISYPSARRLGMGELGNVLDQPNNILGVEYLKAIKRYGSQIKAVTIQRQGAGYNEISPKGGFISATASREMMFKGDFEGLKAYIPPQCLTVINEEINAGRCPISTSTLDFHLTASLRSAGTQGIEHTAYCREGLENRIYKASLKNYGFNAIAQAVKTKRYPLTSLQRLLINFMLGLNSQDLKAFVDAGPQYIRVLGINDTGKKLLANARKKASTPFITKTASYKKYDNSVLTKMLELEFKATDLYTLCYPNRALRSGGTDFLNQIIRV